MSYILSDAGFRKINRLLGSILMWDFFTSKQVGEKNVLVKKCIYLIYMAEIKIYDNKKCML